MELQARDRRIAFPRRPLIMGIVNINDDSFCRDGSLDLDTVCGQARRLMEAGADIIDVGAESARTNREAIAASEEIIRLLPFLERYAEVVAVVHPADEEQVWPPLLSVNTWRTEVAETVLPLGVDLLNDMSALPDARHAEISAENGCALLIMHSVGQPKQPHLSQRYADLWLALESFFDEKTAMARAAGLTDARIILDPGIDFAKQREDNLRLYRELERLTQRYPHPVLLPISRKTVIGEALGIDDPRDRDPATVACLVRGMMAGAAIFRVHNVTAAYKAAKVIHAIRNAGTPEP